MGVVGWTQNLVKVPRDHENVEMIKLTTGLQVTIH
jgi:hypothetical protein